MKTQTYVLIGGGVTSVSAADALRSKGFDGAIVLLGDESEYPYERPPLSKSFLRSEITRPEIALRPADFYAQRAIDLRVDTAVEAINPHERRVQLKQGQQLAYDKLLVATGASPRTLKVPGAELSGIHYLRSAHDCERIKEGLAAKPRVLVIGTGFIGCEVAASVRKLGCETVLVGPTLPLEHVLGREVAELYARYHRARGIELRVGASVTEFAGSKRVEQAKLSDETTVPCETVIVGIGVEPSVSLVPSEVQLANGIATDEYCRTSVEDIFAAGDVAASWRPHLNTRIRFEHFVNAQLQGAAAAKAMLGKLEAYDPVPYFWSDQFDLSLQYYGYAAKWDSCILRGRPEEYSFLALYLLDGRLEAVCGVNSPREFFAVKRLVGKTDVASLLAADETAGHL